MLQKQLKPKISEFVLASHNTGKLAEIEALLKPYAVQVTSAAELNLPEPEETAQTFDGNAQIKALAAAQSTGRYALADDSGLCCYALGGAPGVYSARWAGPEKDFEMAMEKVALELVDHEDHRAAFVSVLAFASPSGDVSFYEGRCEGTIVWPQKGDQGFGYDPIFIPQGETRTFGEMSQNEKAKFSHRAIALEKFIKDVFE